MTFTRSDLLPFVLIVPMLIAGAFRLYARRRRRIALSFSDAALLTRLGGADLVRFPWLRFALIVTAGGLLAFAAAGPRWGFKTGDGRSLSLNIVLATDISKSMLAPDVEPNRLERARLFSRQLLRDLPGDRFGMVVFAGRAYVLSPLTVDHSALELYIDALDPAMVSQGGSSLAASIAQATDLVRGSEQQGGDRAIVLLSDGEALEEANAVIDAANRAARAGVRIITVGVGTTAGDNIPEIDARTGETVGVKRDEYGEIVVSKLDESLLRSVAEQTKGTYVRLDSPGALSRVVSELRQLERTQANNASRVEPRERFAIFAALALLLLAIDALLHGPPLRAMQGIPARPAARPTPRSRARAAIVLLALLANNGFGIGDLEKGNRLYRAGRVEEAVAVYQSAIEKGKATPQLHYNLGTALLALGRFDEAETHLQAALADVEPAMRERTLYNLGNRFLTDARAQKDLQQQGAMLDAAAEAYRRALRIMPEDVDAKWNLELALRERDENQKQQQQQQQDPQDDEQDDQDQQGQSGGGGSGGGQSQASDGNRQGNATDQSPMSPEEADRILSAIEQDERELTREKLRRGQQRVPVLRDW